MKKKQTKNSSLAIFLYDLGWCGQKHLGRKIDVRDKLSENTHKEHTNLCTLPVWGTRWLRSVLALGSRSKDQRLSLLSLLARSTQIYNNTIRTRDTITHRPPLHSETESHPQQATKRISLQPSNPRRVHRRVSFSQMRPTICHALEAFSLEW